MPRTVIEIVPYQPVWPLAFAAEAADLRRIAPVFAELEHIGSTAVPGLAAKPVIDMMAAVERLEAVTPVLPALGKRGYALVKTGMRDRLFLQRARLPGVNLHIVTLASWPERNERLLRDALIAAPKSAADYATLKRRLAEIHADDIAAYTRAKTDFVQAIIDAARDRLSLPREPVWQE
jgi:GrpB-like predicted nucleotidyltransferase (UPF0157 family)